MDSSKIEKLRIAADKFYLNKYPEVPEISDKEYDALEAEYAAEGGSVKSLVSWEKGTKVENKLPIGLNKVAVDDNNLGKAVENFILERTLAARYLNFKYDGGSIIGFYHNGRLQEVRSTPDEAFGIIRTKVFWNIFPHEIEDKSIIAIQGEALVDWTVYGQKARNKANGLLNSVNQDEEAERELFVRVYKVYFTDQDADKECYNYERTYNALKSLPFVTRNRERLGEDGELHTVFDLVFAPAWMFTPDACPTTPLTDIVREYNGHEFHDKFQVDGVVLYAASDSGDLVQGFKFYYTESAITTITNVVWNKAGSGSYQPKLNFETVILNDKNISQAASGGYPNLQAMKMGRGAKVRVILSKMTIPKIIEVLEPSEDYQIPVCECGHQLNPDTDCFGSGLKCTELDCSQRYKDRLDTFNWWIPYMIEQHPDWTESDLFRNDIFGVINLAVNIDRWDSNGKRKDKEESSEYLFTDLKELIEVPHSPHDFKVWMESHFHFPGLCQSILDINYLTADKVLKYIFDKL
jgi:NAD-dependent DNA ligase